MKGQTAVEYLMTYGWAILIILIVAGVLAYYGIFAPSGFLGPTARGFGQIAVLSPWSLAASTGGLTLTVENRVGGTINITQINSTVSGDPNTYVYTLNGGAGISMIQSNRTTLPLGAPTGYPGSWASSSGKSVGGTFSTQLIIKYLYNGQPFTSTGTITGTYS
jgi:hypothetical protein